MSPQIRPQRVEENACLPPHRGFLQKADPVLCKLGMLRCSLLSLRGKKIAESKRQWRRTCSVKGCHPSCFLRAAELSPKDANVEVGSGEMKTYRLMCMLRRGCRCWAEKVQTGGNREGAWWRGSLSQEMPSTSVDPQGWRTSRTLWSPHRTLSHVEPESLQGGSILEEVQPLHLGFDGYVYLHTGGTQKNSEWDFSWKKRER